jgi:hypothetical protein
VAGDILASVGFARQRIVPWKVKLGANSLFESSDAVFRLVDLRKVILEIVMAQFFFRRIQNGVTPNQMIVPARRIILLVSALNPLLAQMMDETRLAASARKDRVMRSGFIV